MCSANHSRALFALTEKLDSYCILDGCQKNSRAGGITCDFAIRTSCSGTAARDRTSTFLPPIPLNYFHVVSHSADLPRLTIDGKLFLPPEIIASAMGSAACDGGAGQPRRRASHLAHAEALVDDGFAAFVLDSFGARDVTSTVANQTQFSFASSAYDVLAAWKVLAAHPDIDASRIGAQGHSRGGSAVMTAATRRFADAVVGNGAGFSSVLAAYPWSGHQFLDPSVGETEIRVVMGDADEWCSPMQVQGHCQAIRLAGGKVAMRLIAGAQHSFDRGTAIVNVPEASVSPAAPTIYIADDGGFIHPLARFRSQTRRSRPDGLRAEGRLRPQGREIGSRDGEAELFKADMLAFWRRTLGCGLTVITASDIFFTQLLNIDTV